MESIDLGRESGSMGAIPAPSDVLKNKNYPHLYLDLDTDELADLPDSGYMEVCFKVVSKTTTERNGKTTTNATLEIQSIEDIESDDEEEANKSDRKKAGDVLDRYAEEESEKE